MMVYIKITQKKKESNYYYSSNSIKLVAENMVLATKTIEVIMASADPRLDTKCELEPYVEEVEDESVQTPQG